MNIRTKRECTVLASKTVIPIAIVNGVIRNQYVFLITTSSPVSVSHIANPVGMKLLETNREEKEARRRRVT